MYSFIPAPDGYISTKDGFIYRLCVAPDGRPRICKNHFNASLSFMHGCVEYKDFVDKEDAQKEFDRLKTEEGNIYHGPEIIYF